MTAATSFKVKPKIGIYGLTSCYGCQLMMATVSKLLDVVAAVDIASFSMISSAGSPHDPVDIAFVEGSVSTEKDIEELKEIRNNSKFLVAMGSCALFGGVQNWVGDDMDYSERYKCVYGDGKISFPGVKATPIEKFVKVDYRLPGCPPEESEIVYFISTFVMGTWPEEIDYPVCHECRLRGNPCILIENREPCLGPVTTAGCNARCISFNVPCIGCRGPVIKGNAWYDSLALTFKEKGFTKEYIKQRMRIFGAANPKLDEMINKIYGGEE